MENTPAKNDNGSSHWGGWLGMILAVAYTLLPVDLLPDAIPLGGWIDDTTVLLAGILNLVQSYLGESHAYAAKIVKYLKWTVILLGVLIIAILALTGVLIYNAAVK